MDKKPQPNRAVYVRTLRHMTPEQRLSKAFELTAMTRGLLRAGLRERFPDRTEEEIERLYVARFTKCSTRHS